MNYHSLDVDYVLESLKSGHGGLSHEEAQARLINGKNKLAEKREPPFILRFFGQFNDFMVVILLLAAALSFIANRIHNERAIDPLIILAIVVLNALLGLAQERRAEKALAALSDIAAPMAKVRRGGQVVEVLAHDIVVGDIVLLEAGGIVPADLRLIETSNLKLEEAALTGESLPIEKHTAQSNDVSPLSTGNMAFSGSPIAYGRGLGVVVAIGMDTEIGRIANMIMEEEAPQTPLQKRLANLGRALGIAALLICAAIFIIGIFRMISPLDMFITSVSLAVAAIPEGLVAIVTIMLAIGTTRMARHNAIIRKLPAVETLGSCSVICSDKTGTLTQNKMTIVEFYGDSNDLLKLGSLCNNCQVSFIDD